MMRLLRKTVITLLCAGVTVCLASAVWVVFALGSCQAGDRDLRTHPYYINVGSWEGLFGLTVSGRTSWRPLTHVDEAKARYRAIAERPSRGDRDFSKSWVTRRTIAAGPFHIEFNSSREFDIWQERHEDVWRFTQPTVEA